MKIDDEIPDFCIAFDLDEECVYPECPCETIRYGDYAKELPELMEEVRSGKIRRLTAEDE